MGMLLHRHLQGTKKSPAKVEEKKLDKEFEIVKKEKANGNKRKDNDSKNASK